MCIYSLFRVFPLGNPFIGPVNISRGRGRVWGGAHLPKSEEGRAEEEGTLASMTQKEVYICTVLSRVAAGRQTLEGGQMSVCDGRLV